MTIIQDVLKDIVALVDDKQAENIVSFTLTESSVTDCILLISGKNKTHCRALVDHISQFLKPFLSKDDSEHFYKIPHRSGNVESGWIILDLNSIIIHILAEDVRHYYELDQCFQERGVAFHY